MSEESNIKRVEIIYKTVLNGRRVDVDKITVSGTRSHQSAKIDQHARKRQTQFAYDNGESVTYTVYPLES